MDKPSCQPQPQPETCQRTKSMFSIIVDDFDSKLEKENVEKEKSCDENVDSKGKEGNDEKSKSKEDTTDNKSLKQILDEVEHRKDEFRKLIDEHNAVIENLKKIEKVEDSNLKDANTSNLVKTTIRT